MPLCTSEQGFMEGDNGDAVVYLGAGIPGRIYRKCRCVPRHRESRKDIVEMSLFTSEARFLEGDNGNAVVHLGGITNAELRAANRKSQNAEWELRITNCQLE